MKTALTQHYLIFCLFLLVIFFPLTATAEKNITAWTYYDDPPFITGKEQGLIYDFVNLINTRAKEKYKLHVVIYPRKRIEAHLKAKEQGIVLFVHWSWMEDILRTKYLWTPSFLADTNEIISRADRKIEYDGKLSSLEGLIFGGVLGHNYPLTEAVNSGKIIRVDCLNHTKNIEKILRNRIDFTILLGSTLNYLTEKLRLDGLVHISSIPLGPYTRHLLVTKGLQEKHGYLSDLIQALNNDDVWKRTLAKYGLKSQLPVP